ncbi:MAG: hypothetical protein KGK03_00765 [Candidatus Omnitrophica bacterium]|nr:hypothetical protein [Candidatus Omnitrophota bacterium]MDE2221586.1 hypothetical protein [Candidatus Omnitrophota bacterium]
MHKRGQSIIEYILIAILVILGIVFMGSYVLRSVNAHFRLWDVSVRESAEEIINQAPVNNVPDIPLNCHCTSEAGSCGTNQNGSLCAANQREYHFNCNLPGCNGSAGAETCVLDESCCNTPQPLGCGSAPLPNQGHAFTCPSLPAGISGPCYCPAGSGPAAHSYCPTTSDPNSIYNNPNTTCCPPQATGTTSSCYYGQQIYGYACGSNSSQFCILDGSCPLPKCTGFVLFQNAATFCDTVPTAGLKQDTPYCYVDSSSSCDTPQSSCGGNSKCELYCNPPYTLTPPNPPDRTQATCSLDFNVAASCCNGPDAFDPSCDPSTNSSNPTKLASDSCHWYNYGSRWVTVNNQSFQICLNTTSTATSVKSAYALPAGNTASNTYHNPALSPTNGGCGAIGLPSQLCSISIDYGCTGNNC